MTGSTGTPEARRNQAGQWIIAACAVALVTTSGGASTSAASGLSGRVRTPNDEGFVAESLGLSPGGNGAIERDDDGLSAGLELLMLRTEHQVLVAEVKTLTFERDVALRDSSRLQAEVTDLRRQLAAAGRLIADHSRFVQEITADASPRPEDP